MSTESNNPTQRALGDYAEDHSQLSPVSVGQECARVNCDRTMSKRFAQSHSFCAFCQSTGDDA